jgi:Golgi nucleoside diphosphatase
MIVNDVYNVICKSMEKIEKRKIKLQLPTSPIFFFYYLHKSIIMFFVL